MVDKFRRVRPVTLGEASRIPGVTPAAVLVLDIHLSYSGGVFHVERGVRGRRLAVRHFLCVSAWAGEERGIGDVDDAFWGGVDAFEVGRLFVRGGAAGGLVGGVGGSFDSVGVGLWSDSGVVGGGGGQVLAGEAGGVGLGVADTWGDSGGGFGVGYLPCVVWWVFHVERVGSRTAAGDVAVSVHFGLWGMEDLA